MYTLPFYKGNFPASIVARVLQYDPEHWRSSRHVYGEKMVESGDLFFGHLHYYSTDKTKTVEQGGASYMFPHWLNGDMPYRTTVYVRSNNIQIVAILNPSEYFPSNFLRQCSTSPRR